MTLSKSPIIECLIEIYIPNQFDWKSEDAIKHFYEKELKSKYPKDRSQDENKIEFRLDSGSLISNLSSLTRYRFLAEEESSLVQIGTCYCIFNQLKPYPESFSNVFDKAKPIFNSYMAFTSKSVNDRKIKALGIRYINEIKLSNVQEISDILKIYPSFKSLKKATQDVSLAFALQVKAPHPKYDIVINLSHTASTDGINSYTFDLYGRSNHEFSYDQISEEIVAIQSVLEEIFFESLTETGYKMFK